MRTEATLRQECCWLPAGEDRGAGRGHPLRAMVRVNLFLAFAVLVLASSIPSTASSSSLTPPASRFTAHQEGLVKATYIQGFAVFMKWPSHSSLHKHSHFRVCTFGERQAAMFHEKIVTLVAQSKNVSLWHRFGEETPPECDIAMISSRDPAITESAIASLKDQPTLVIGDLDSEPKAAFAVQFKRSTDGKIEYRVNRQMLKARGLDAPARILGMASEVDQ
jgi:hypothetical protein